MRARIRELLLWVRFFKIMLKLNWQSRHDAPCRQKIRRIIRATEKQMWEGE